MKYVITESQYNLILESQRHIQFFKDLINNRLDYIRRVCNKGADDYQGDVGERSCTQIEYIDKVDVTSAEWVAIEDTREEKQMRVKIMIYYTSIRRGDFDADDLIYDLRRMICKSTGMPLVLIYESTNTNTSFEW